MALWPLGVLANMANPIQPGQPVGEPSGALRTVAIEHEALAIDLRPLAQDDPAEVTATYRVRQDGPSETVDLLFVAPSLAAPVVPAYRVTLDGQPVASRSGESSTLPASWQPPSMTPGIGGQPPLDYQVAGGKSALAFSLTLAPGTHEISVVYPAQATSYSGSSPARYWQLGYVLAPARQWASFGDLAVTVQLPPGWLAASTPPLTRSGDTLAGTFQGVPADSLALTTRYPAPAPTHYGPVLLIAVPVLTLVLAGAIGYALRRRGRRLWWALLPALPFGVAWMATVAVAGTIDTPNVPGSQEAWTYGYGSGLATVAVALLALPAGMLLSVLAARLGRRVARRAGPGRRRGNGPHPPAPCMVVVGVVVVVGWACGQGGRGPAVHNVHPDVGLTAPTRVGVL
ncbi:MAG TPA: hypothetical protein VMU89_05500 [Thermomicrobiaceae bacterium]|nr:hypothetical protein [Thermomicrobiaceae bacterium]